MSTENFRGRRLKNINRVSIKKSHEYIHKNILITIVEQLMRMLQFNFTFNDFQTISIL